MKRSVFVATLVFLSIAISSAQEAFKSLSFGVEVGTTGVGVELALPMVTDHVVLKAGFNAPSLAVNRTFTVGSSIVNDVITDFNNQITSLGLDAEDMIETRFSDIDVTASPVINFSTAKLLLELYPSKKSSFHFTLGAYYGMGDNLINATVSSNKTTWNEYKAVVAEIDAVNAKYAGEPGYVAHNADLKVNLDGRTYGVKEDGGVGVVAADLKVARLRPYLGFGFGRSVPKSHVGFQFDLGVWYHGKPEITSPNQLSYDQGAYDISASVPAFETILSYMDYAVIYPQLTLRLIYKIF